jgi:hypothetical protein
LVVAAACFREEPASFRGLSVAQALLWPLHKVGPPGWVVVDESLEQMLKAAVELSTIQAPERFAQLRRDGLAAMLSPGKPFGMHLSGDNTIH